MKPRHAYGGIGADGLPAAQLETLHGQVYPGPLEPTP